MRSLPGFSGTYPRSLGDDGRDHRRDRRCGRKNDIEVRVAPSADAALIGFQTRILASRTDAESIRVHAVRTRRIEITFRLLIETRQLVSAAMPETNNAHLRATYVCLLVGGLLGAGCAGEE